MDDLRTLPDGSLAWTGGAAVCADGSRRAYSPPGSGLQPLDLLANAYRNPREHPADPMRPASGWCGVVLGRDGRPVVQGDGDPAPGYLVSPTALVDPAHPLADPRRYLDAEVVAYMVVPVHLLTIHGGPLTLGDVGQASYRGRSVAVVIGEVGPGRREISVAAAVALGIPSSPRNGGVDAGVSYRAWPGTASSPAWPRTAEDVAAQVAGLVGPAAVQG